MNYAEMGTVFNYLLRWREIAGNPSGRSLRDGEFNAARILADCNSAALEDFESFLNAQGFTLADRAGIEFGIPPKPNTPNTIWVLTRKRGLPVASYIDSRWYVDMMRDGRGGAKEAKRHETVFWTARMWLTLQWFFYEKIDRLPSEVSRYGEALVSKRLFVEELASGIEKMGNAGRPEGAAGTVWDHLWKNRSKVETWAGRFLSVMERSGMIAPSGNDDEWRQSVLASIEMADNAANEISYLIPSKGGKIALETTALLLGEDPVALGAGCNNKNKEAADAADQQD